MTTQPIRLTAQLIPFVPKPDATTSEASAVAAVAAAALTPTPQTASPPPSKTSQPTPEPRSAQMPPPDQQSDSSSDLGSLGVDLDSIADAPDTTPGPTIGYQGPPYPNGQWTANGIPLNGMPLLFSQTPAADPMQKSTSTPPAALGTAATAPAVVPAVVLVASPLPQTIDLGFIEIRGVRYKATGHNLTLDTDEEKGAFKELLTQQLSAYESSLDQITLRFEEDSIKLCSENQVKISYQNETTKDICSKLLNNSNSTITFQQIRIRSTAITPPPPAIVWGWNNCYWASILWVYLMNRSVQDAIESSIGDSPVPSSVGLLTLIADLKNNPSRKLTAEQSRKMLVDILDAEDAADKKLLANIRQGLTLDVRDVWSRLRTLSNEPFHEFAVQSDSTELQDLGSELQSELADTEPSVIDVRLETNNYLPPLSFTSEKGKTYALQGLIFHKDTHYTSLVRKPNEQGIMQTYLCDNLDNNHHPIADNQYETIINRLLSDGFTITNALYSS